MGSYDRHWSLTVSNMYRHTERTGLQHKMKPKPETLRAFDNTSIQSVGIVSLKLNMGKIEVVQQFTVVESKEARMTTMLGRDFQMKFQSVEFLWQEGKIRISTEWFTPKMWVCGGEMSKRITIASCHNQDKLEFDINPDLEPPHERQELETLLMEYADCFATNPKKPTVAHVGEHVIETLPGARPIKSKHYSMSPRQEQEVE